jgi:hypothetical protein
MCLQLEAVAVAVAAASKLRVLRVSADRAAAAAE